MYKKLCFFIHGVRKLRFGKNLGGTDVKITVFFTKIVCLGIKNSYFFIISSHAFCYSKKKCVFGKNLGGYRRKNYVLKKTLGGTGQKSLKYWIMT
jgi:hypothetical protein